VIHHSSLLSRLTLTIGVNKSINRKYDTDNGLPAHKREIANCCFSLRLLMFILLRRVQQDDRPIAHSHSPTSRLTDTDGVIPYILVSTLLRLSLVPPHALRDKRSCLPVD